MMGRNRTIQLVAILAGFLALAGASALVPVINAQRRELKLAAETEFEQGTAPKHVLLAAALGSFRGLAVDYLWYRAEQLKQEGKFYDAKALADWITTLQPRFPQVWVNRAWNMAFNISVETHTPQERWDWVNKGVRLLRDEGIVHNPGAVSIYRQLGWIFFFKIGRFTDDMHWYYKIKLAEEWELLLGAPTEGATHDQAMEAFRPIAEAAEQYLAISRPSRQVERRLEWVAEEHPSLAHQLRELSGLTLDEFDRRLGELEQQLRAERWDSALQKLDLIRAMVSEQRQRARIDPLSLLYADVPAAQEIVERLGKIGFKLDSLTLNRIGRIQMFLRYTDEQFVRKIVGSDSRDKQLLTIVTDSHSRTGLDAVLALLRAKVLIEDYHMDPVKMLQLMEYFGPLDWRHPASHGAYWSYLGVEKSGVLRDRDATKYDVLNTDRQVIHAMQQLFTFGGLSFDPIRQHIDLLPDPRFAPAYDRAMRDAIERAKTTTWQGGGNVETFENGHENFLIRAIVYHYLYGDLDSAREYYQDVRQLYGDKDFNVRTGRYLLPLDDFVINDFRQDSTEMRTARVFIDGMLVRGFRDGLKNRHFNVFGRFSRLAKTAYDRFQAERSTPNPTTPRVRLGLPATWEETLVDSYSSFMRNPAYHLIERQRIFVNTPVLLQLASYGSFRDTVLEQARQMGMDGQAAFPSPPGFEQREIRLEDALDRVPGTIERQ